LAGVADFVTMRIGFLINPIAGMDGRVGLKGTDGVVDRAVALGAEPVAPAKALEMLNALWQLLESDARRRAITWLTCSGVMGHAALRAAGFNDITVVYNVRETMSSADTSAAVRAFLAQKVELIVFCGGDGTARDIAAITHETVPILGIPSGVKMYSGVFGVSTQRTAELIFDFVRGDVPVAKVDVIDLDEDRYRAGEWAVHLYYSAITPFAPTRTQVAKALIVESDDKTIKGEIAEDLCEQICANPDTLHLLGPGSTIQAIADGLGITKTLLGIDALLGRDVVGHDLNEASLLGLLEKHPEARLIVSPIGAQGFVLGRGNLQISPAVIRRIGIDNIIVVATPAKLARTPVLRFDTGDASLDAAFQAKAYLAVTTGFHRRRLVPLAQ
jgi:predicted polyphosphate/ATP-dependent NAD kinase